MTTNTTIKRSTQQANTKLKQNENTTIHRVLEHNEDQSNASNPGNKSTQQT